MIGLFALALFTSAMLLFWVQPMVAKMLLPLLGGTPTVWNTCVVFFQAMLLAGYAYAHFLTTRLSRRGQAIVHLALLAVTMVALPVRLPADAIQSAPWQSNPFVWLLRALVVVVALPFFTVSASAPLLQSWFGGTRHRLAKDPYFLYAASNCGSLLGLIGYPLLIEPRLHLPQQTWLWSILYGGLIVLFAGSAIVVWKSGVEVKEAVATQTATVTWARRWQWIFWAFIPSSLMLGVTTYLTTDIASVPLLWVVPLGIYLFTFILVFSRRELLPAWLLNRLLPMVATILMFIMLVSGENLQVLQFGLHLGFFFIAAMVWHGRLAKDRPPTGELTQFYFCMSIGGVLGGLFNALLAPILFRGVVEYPLVIVLACLPWPLMAKGEVKVPRFWRGLALPASVGVVTAILAIVVPQLSDNLRARVILIFGIPIVLCYGVLKLRGAFHFTVGLAATLLGSTLYTGFHGRAVHKERNFFGILWVTTDASGGMRRLYHGTTVHGMQFVAPKRQGEPLAYYHREGPCGYAMEAINARGGATNFSLIGLGTGAMAAYARSGQRWTFYEIDPAVIGIASNTNYFTYLAQATNAPVDFKTGDARLRLREAPEHSIDVLVCDAFGSDAPPLHLLTREAMELYLSKLAPNGVMLFHVSSRYLNFRPVLGNLAAHFHLHALVGVEELEVTEEILREGRLGSIWIAMAHRPEDLGSLNENWPVLRPDPGKKLWTDDYSNILTVFEGW